MGRDIKRLFHFIHERRAHFIQVFNMPSFDKVCYFLVIKASFYHLKPC